MFNRRVSKTHPRVEACGAVDELNAALGLARATAEQSFIRDHVLAIQKDLVILMGELATLPDDRPRLEKAGFSTVTPAMTAKLDQLVDQLEAENVTSNDWIMPGETLNSAALDWCRTTCRRAERQVCCLKGLEAIENQEVLVYLNRLSDTLWLLARWAEIHHPAFTPPSTA